MPRTRSKGLWEDRVPSSMGTTRLLLRKAGYECHVTSSELVAWLKTDTPYLNPSNESLLKNPYLVIHEAVEINEVKKMGLRITKDVIVRNMERINDAHLTASIVEFDIAAKDAALDHLRSRYGDLRSWCEDPLLTPVQKERYEAFRAETERRLRALESK